MSKVLLDNWELFTCAKTKLDFDVSDFHNYYMADSSVIDVCWQNLLTSLILWDDLYTCWDSDIYNLFKKFFSKYCDNLNFLHNTDLQSIPSEEPHIQKINELYKKIKQDNLSPEQNRLLLRGYKYLVDSNYLQCNYLPHPYRANLLYNSGLFEKQFTRTTFLDILDEKVNEYIDEVNELCKHQLLTTNFPLLYKYIYDHSSSYEDELLFALTLRNEKNVIKFRKSINKIENNLKNGNIFDLHASLKEVSEICSNITEKMYKKPMSFSVSLGLSPTFNFGVNAEINTTRKIKSKLNTTFLYNLTEFAIKGDPQTRYYKLKNNPIV